MHFPKRTPRASWAAFGGLLALTLSGSAAAVDFSGIAPAETVAESKARAAARRDVVLRWFAELPLPTANDEDPDPNNNPRLDSRTDVRRITDRATARILLGLPTDAVEEVIVDPRTNAFAIVGSSNAKSDPGDPCHRNGDYDFALINWLRLAYGAREHQGVLSQQAYDVIVRRLLTVSGNEHSKTFRLRCLGIPIDLQDTENHILMLEVSRYLTNQLLVELPENTGNEALDNELNGNNVWMLEYLATFMREMFDEYNSRPYQGYTVLALSVLNSYAADPRVALTAGMLLDLVSGWTAVQSNQLRRFPPFRRQPQYILPDEIDASGGWYSWVGDGEAERLTFLVGNYGYLQKYDYKLPQGDGLSHFILTAASGSYRMDDVLLDLAIREDGKPRFLLGRHDNVEIYASSASTLISAGGHFDEAVPPAVDGLPPIIEDIVGAIVVRSTDKQHGWGRPTTLVPTREASSDLRDMIRFDGHQDLKQRENTCVGPGFACGLTPRLGNLVEPVAGQCSVSQGSWRFFDFRAPACPLDYGFYLALLEQPCDTDPCRERSESGTYGLLEVAEAATSSFSAFREAVLENNPSAFGSTGEHTYQTTTGHRIAFEIDPSPGRSSLIALDGVKLDRDFSHWAMARGDTIQSTTPGRFTFDSPGLRKRLILDVTRPGEPRRFSTDLPALRRVPSEGGDEGRFFDDGGAVVPGKGVAWVALRAGERVNGVAMGWRSGLEASHGGDGSESRLTLDDEETIVELGIGVVSVYDRLGVGRLRIRTSAGRELIGGAAAEQFTFTAEPGEQVIAFYGRSGAEIDRLGVMMAPVSAPEPVDGGLPDGDPPDGGSRPDTGTEAGGTDAGVADAGAGFEAPGTDAGDEPGSGGCACRVREMPRRPQWSLAWIIAALLLFRRNKRSERPR